MISQVEVFSNPYWEYFLEKYILPDGSEGDYHYVNSRGSTMIIAKDSDDKFLMIKQYRYLNKKISLEFPGGGLKKNNDYLTNALEELKEETGYLSDNLDFIGKFNPCNGITNEICNCYYTNKIKYSGSNPEKTEEFEICMLSGNEIDKLIENNEIWDGMTLAVWMLFKFSKYNDLIN